MDLLKSVVLAACVTGVVALIAAFVSARTAKRINLDKMDLDLRLAREQAEAEIRLAERRMALDHQLAVAKRKAELAERVLADFYEARRGFEIIRSPLIWANEMVAEEGVSQDVIENDGYGVVRRLRQHAELFSKLEATRFSFGALFGQPATKPYDTIIGLHNQVFHAAQDLLKYRHQQDSVNLQDHLRRMRRTAFSDVVFDDDGNEVPDKVAASLTEAVDEIEATCRPALESPLAAEALGRQ